jgi:hypothetical protein
MKFYTDPEFFFNIWCNELIKDNETRKIEKKRRKVSQNACFTLSNLQVCPLIVYAFCLNILKF